MTWQDLKAYVNAPAADDDLVEANWTEAHALITVFIGDAVVPVAIHDRARIVVGAELYGQRAAPNGIAQFATFDGQSAIRVARDPMTGAYPLLSRFVPLGIA
jgi:hypothetical protein